MKRSKLQRLGVGPVRDLSARNFHVVLDELVEEQSLAKRRMLKDELAPLYEQATDEIVDWSIQIDTARKMQRIRPTKNARGKIQFDDKITSAGLKLAAANPKLSRNAIVNRIYKAQRKKSRSKTTIRRRLEEAGIAQPK